VDGAVDGPAAHVAEGERPLAVGAGVLQGEDPARDPEEREAPPLHLDEPPPPRLELPEAADGAARAPPARTLDAPSSSTPRHRSDITQGDRCHHTDPHVGEARHR
jgi:hypothetical protein